MNGNSNFNQMEIYQNSRYTNDRKKTMSLILNITEEGTDTTDPKCLTSGSDFSVDLFEPLLIDKKSTVYIDSFLTYNSNISNKLDNCGFALKINEFNVQSICNKSSDNKDNISGRILIPNEKHSLSHYYSTVQHKAKKYNYVCDINPCRLTKITGNVKNIGGKPAFAGSVSTNNRIIGIFNIEASWDKPLGKADDGTTTIVNIAYSIDNGATYANTALTNAEVISDSPMNSATILLSVSLVDYKTIMELEQAGVGTSTFQNNLENITNIKLTADSNGGGAVTEIKGNDKFFIKQDQGFKLITEFVIVSE